MSKAKSKRPAKFLLYQANNHGGDKGHWLWRVTQGKNIIAGCTEHYVNKSDCVRSATITMQAIVARLTEQVFDDGEPATP